MMISTRGRYALRLMLDLAEHQGNGYVALKDSAQRQDISKKYLEQIIPTLNRFDLLRTTRGYQGGYRLARNPEDYTLGDILRATEGSLAPVACLEAEHNTCAHQADCATLPIWRGLDKVINDYLDGITLQDILDQQAERRGNDYVI
ncbi:MAG: Rrf2 family transcriptional regulator [Ruminococcaceae bacterium]|nr:Rrf2 family transcriptional regulator [Oscillospiraceae bacterium]